ncbi:MAG: hypothetical protein KUL77_00715 [Thermomonas sp.]|uniref:DUF6270 domain-containing protein n=1 Tax=Thermomonas sp. TaxID=1971895 RepID=UPI001ED6F6AE|nr:DUF6270 domain-containing protein [Thermomonas sp.]MBV2208071.1 hypothetical protein [Thermomonas sp.]
MKILIFGSCNSRDPFTHEESNNFHLVDYFARSSFASLSGKKIDFDLDLSGINSNFQKRMVFADANKTFLDAISNKDFDYLVIDFTDDRFDILELQNGSLITLSAEFRKTLQSNKSLPSQHKIIKGFSEEFFLKWVSGWTTLRKALKQTNQLSKVLINCINWSKFDNCNEFFSNSQYINIANSDLNRKYNFLTSELNSNQFIKYPEELFVSDSKHRWGRTPFHFKKEVDLFFINCLRSIS